MTLEIIPNLMVENLNTSLKFYSQVVGLDIEFIINRDKALTQDPLQGVFALMRRDNASLMLQTRTSLIDELPMINEMPATQPQGTIYFRNIRPSEVCPHLSPDQILKGPFIQWYGMEEIYFTDPDGYIICVGCMAEASNSNSN